MSNAFDLIEHLLSTAGVESCVAIQRRNHGEILTVLDKRRISAVWLHNCLYSVMLIMLTAFCVSPASIPLQFKRHLIEPDSRNGLERQIKRPILSTKEAAKYYHQSLIAQFTRYIIRPRDFKGRTSYLLIINANLNTALVFSGGTSTILPWYVALKSANANKLLPGPTGGVKSYSKLTLA